MEQWAGGIEQQLLVSKRWRGVRERSPIMVSAWMYEEPMVASPVLYLRPAMAVELRSGCAPLALPPSLPNSALVVAAGLPYLASLAVVVSPLTPHTACV